MGRKIPLDAEGEPVERTRQYQCAYSRGFSDVPFGVYMILKIRKNGSAIAMNVDNGLERYFSRGQLSRMDRWDKMPRTAVA